MRSARQQHPRPARRVSTGFTLVEILIVVVILGILAALIAVKVNTSTEDSMRTTFVNNIRSFAQLAGVYRAQTGEMLEDATSGVCPAGLEAFMDPKMWERITPIGGVWDSELNEAGVTSAIGVHFNGSGPTRDDAFMQLIDATLDDGDLGTGSFRKLAAARYYLVLIP